MCGLSARGHGVGGSKLDAVVADARVGEILDWRSRGGRVDPGADVAVVVVDVGVAAAVAGGGGGGLGFDVAAFLEG